jgi:hypothetical protein
MGTMMSFKNGNQEPVMLYAYGGMESKHMIGNVERDGDHYRPSRAF